MNKKLFLVATLFCLNFAAFVQATSTPVIARVYNDRFSGQEPFDQSLGSYGAIDTIFGTSGSLSLSAQFSGSQAKAVKVLSDGSILVALDNDVDTKIVKYTPTGAVHTAGFGTSGIVTLTGKTNTRSMTIDSKGRILVCGGNAADANALDGWIVRVPADGSAATTFTGTTWDFVGAVAEQSSGNIIAVGRNAANGKIARYTQAGVLDSTSGFGDAGSGTIVLNGIATTTTGLYNIVVASNDKFLVSYKHAGNQDITKYLATGTLDNAFDTDGVVSATYLNGSTAEQNRLVIDNSGNIIAAAQVSGSIKVTGRLITDGTAHPTFANVTITDADSLSLVDLVATNDGNILVFSYAADQKMRVDSLTSVGILDSSFATAGTLEFSIGLPDTSAILSRGAVTPDGRIFAAGWQVDSGTTTPYLSRIFGKLLPTTNKFLSAVAQQPVTVEEGDVDTAFGGAQTNDGIVRTFDGLYGASMQQTADAVIELASLKMLVGISGYTNTSATSNMILSRLNTDGTIDAGFGTSGFVELSSHGSLGAHITSMLENLADNSILISGYCASGAIIRLHSNTGAETAYFRDATVQQSLQVLVQGTQRVVVFNNVDGTHGQIAAYTPSLGSLDTTFNALGGVAGQIRIADFGLTNMGPLYGAAIDAQNNIFIAYKNASTGRVDAAKIKADGSGLVTLFGTNGIKADLFGATAAGAIANVQDVRLALDNEGELIIAAVLTTTNTGYKVKRLFAADGSADATFGTVTVPVGTVAVLNNLGILNDNTIVLTGADNATNDSMITARVTTTAGVGGLDTTFNLEGANPGVLPLQIGSIVSNYTRAATNLAVQSATGNMILTGYEKQTASLSVPMVIRVFGKSGTSLIAQYPARGTTDVAGTLDTLYDIDNDGDGDGSKDLTALIAAGAAKSVYVYRSGSTYQGYLLVAVETLADTKIARIRESDGSLDLSFGGGTGIITLTGLNQVKHLSIDANNKILVGGIDWARRLTANGAADVSFATLAAIVEINVIAQQKSGRYIVGGLDSSGNGVVAAFKDKLVGVDTQLQLDTTFNPLGATAIATPGLYRIASSLNIPTLVINSDDTILVAYSDSGTTNVKISKLQANGAALVSGFGTSGIKDTTWTPSNSSSIRVAVDNTGKVIVAASVGGNSVNVIRYNSTASAIDGGFNSGAVNNVTHLGSAGVTLANMIIDADNKILIFGNNTAGANGLIYAARLGNSGSDGVLDAAWNAVPSGVDIAGVKTFTVGSATNLYGADIYINGMIYLAGWNNSGGAGVPLLFRMFGNDYVGQLEQQPFEVAAGLIDTTLDASGALDLNSYLATLGLNPSPAQKFHMYADGSMLLAFTYNTGGFNNTIIARLKKDFTLDTTGFNAAALGSPAGSITISGHGSISDMFVNDGANGDNYIYAAGITSGAPWAAKISTAGVVTSLSIPNTASMDVLTAIRITTNNRILLVGHSTAAGAGATPSGIVAAYVPSGTGLDLTFGNGIGFYVTNVDTPIVDVGITQYDDMFITYKNGSAITVDRIEPNGSGLATGLWSGGTISIAAAFGGFAVTPQVNLAVDETNHNLVVAAQDGTGADNHIVIKRYRIDGAATSRGATDFTIAGKTLQLADLLIDNTTPGNDIYTIGTNSTDSKIVVARLTSDATITIAMDATYGASGIANLTPGANMTSVVGGAIHPDRRVYVIGYQGTPKPSIARIFGDAYVSQIQKENVVGVAGGIDLTLDGDATASPVGGLVISGLTGYTGKAVYANANGSNYVALSDGINLKVGKLDADGHLVTSGFGTAGLTATIPMATVNSMIVDTTGKILVCGIDAGVQKVVRITSAGILDSPTFSNTLGFTLSTGTQIVQQASGRIITASYDSSNTRGVVVAYKNDGSGEDTTYGAYLKNGFYTTGVNAVIDDVVLDSYDNAYIVYRNTTVKVEKIVANGSVKDVTFGGGLVVDTGITATTAARIAINDQGVILVGAGDATNIYFLALDGTTGLASVNGHATSIQTISTGTPVLTDMTGAGDNFVMSAYRPAASMLAVRVLGWGATPGVLDGAFGSSGVAVLGTPGTATQMNGIAVQADGKIIMIGKQDVPSVNPVIIRTYQTPYVGQFAQYSGIQAAGTVDITLSPTSGALDLDTLFSGIAGGLETYTATRMYTYTNNNMLILFQKSDAFILVRAHKDFTLDASFNASGTPGYVKVTGLSGLTIVSSLYVDSSGHIFVGGGVGASFVKAYDATGAVLSGWVDPVGVSNNLSAGANALAGQSMSRLILGGKDTNGMLYGYTTTGALDPEFGNGVAGKFDTGIAQKITDISVDSNDNILAVWNDGANNSVLKRIFADGSADDGTLPGTGTAIATLSGKGLKVIEDNAGHVIVAGATTAGFKLARYSAVDGSNAGAQVTVAAGGGSTSYLTQLYTTTDAKIVMIGFEQTTNHQVVVRLKSDFTVDATFGTAGVFSAQIGTLLSVWGGALYNDDRIMLLGDDSSEPFMGRLFGDNYNPIVAQAPTLGVAGVIDTTYHAGGATPGSFNPGTLDTSVLHSRGKVAMTTAVGGHYLAFDNNSSASQLIRTKSNDALDLTYHTTGIADSAPQGVVFMMLDGSGRVLLSGNNSNGWIQRYTIAGAADGTFGTAGLIQDVGMLQMNAIVEQTSARVVGAGMNAAGKSALRGYTDRGVLDTTFNSTGAIPGEYSFSSNTSGIFTLVADQYDRLLVAFNDGAGNVSVTRFTSNGELDYTFGNVSGGHNTGTIAVAIAGAGVSSAPQLLLDDNGRIIVAVMNAAQTGVKIAAFDNGIASNNNGAVVGGYTAGTPVTGLTGALLTTLVATEDEDVLVGGYESANNAMWVARLTNTGLLDAAGFNPAAIGGTAGVMKFTIAAGVQTNRVLANMAVKEDGRLSLIGYEIASGVTTPFLARAYNDPYQVAIAETPNSKTIGTDDITLGLTSANGISFFALSATEADTSAQQQVVRAIALQGDNRILAVLDGQDLSDTSNKVFLNRFNIDGLVDINFNTTGQLELPHLYGNEYAQDAVAFTTPAGVNKAIIAGYASNPVLSVSTSWLLQYNLDTVAVDSTFGGVDNDGPGTASGDIKQFNTVARQASGRTIGAGLHYDNSGAIVGYTTTGKLDKSFGADGFYFNALSTTGICSHVIDSKDRVVFAYNNGTGVVVVARLLADGSGLDSSFGGGAITTSITGIKISPADQIRVAVDSNDDVYVVAVNGGGLGVQYDIRHYGVGGGLSVSNAITSGPLGGITALTIARIFVDTNGKLTIIGADHSANDDFLIVKLTTGLALDTAAFNGLGYLKYKVDPVKTIRQDVCGIIHNDGRVIAGGSEA